jgi:hypothetical protein
MDNNPTKREISFGIDSATLRLPIKKGLELGEYLSSKFILYCLNTDEYEDVRTNPTKHKSDRGISTYYKIRKNQILRGSKRGELCDVLEITLLAKSLGSPYLDGIRPNNIRTVYDYLISQGYFKCSYDYFLSGSLIDVDFKADIYFNNAYTPHSTPLDGEYDINSLIKVDTEPALKKVKQNIDAFIKRTKTDIRAKGRPTFFKHQQPDNYGVVWYERRKGESKGSVAIKYQNTRVYAKGVELHAEKGSNEFRKEFLSDRTDLHSILRIETNGIKNAKSALSNYGITDTSLRNVLTLTLDDCRPMFSEPFRHFLESDYRPSKPRENNPLNILLASYIRAEFIANPSMSFDGIFDRLEVIMNSTERGFKNKQNRYYHKKAIREAYDNEYGSGTISDDRDELSEVIKSFLNHSF